MLHQLRLFFTALEFFTRIPKPAWVGFDPLWLGAGARYFPLVGVLVGVVSALALLLTSLVLPLGLAAVFALAVGIWITGAFHEDGFADCCDGFGATREPQRILEIMKDSRVGAFAAIGVALLLVGKIQAIAHAASVFWAIIGLVLAHTSARCGSLWVMVTTPYVQDHSDAAHPSKAKPVVRHAGWPELLIGLITTLVVGAIAAITVVFLQVGTTLETLQVHVGLIVGAVMVGLLVPRLLGVWLNKRLGGINGDCLGCAEQCGELAVLCLFAAKLPL